MSENVDLIAENPQFHCRTCLMKLDLSGEDKKGVNNKFVYLYFYLL